jgi:hypothetical protein
LFWLGVPRNGTGSFALYAVLVLGWLYDRSGRSVLPAVLLHTGVNTSGSVVPATMETLETFPLATDIAGTGGWSSSRPSWSRGGSRDTAVGRPRPESTDGGYRVGSESTDERD